VPNVGICFVRSPAEVSSEFVVRTARKTEEAGLHSFWINDRITGDYLEPTTVAAAAAAVTQTIKIGTSVLLAALRSPVLLAKTLASIDFLSGGRLITGIGFGGSQVEFDAMEVPFKGRGLRAVEQLHLMKRLWQEQDVNHQGRYFCVSQLTIGPRPSQNPHPPVWMGGTADVVLERVAKLADGYICGTGSLQRFGDVWDKICTYAIKSGRDPGLIEKAGISYVAVDENKGRALAACEAYLNRYYGKITVDIERNGVIGSPAECAARLASLFEKGFRTLILRAVIPDLQQLDLLGDKILPMLVREEKC
jgi:probable F420-dependent oxidoreductase